MTQLLYHASFWKSRRIDTNEFWPIFILDIPRSAGTYRTVMVLTFIGLSPLCGSHEPPSLRDLIIWGCDWTEVSLSSLPVIAVAAVPCGVRSDQLARPREQTTERTYPVCWYSIVKEQEGYFSTHPLVSSLKGKNTTLFQKNFFDFFVFYLFA